MNQPTNPSEQIPSPPWPPATRAIVAVVIIVLLGLAAYTFRIVVIPLVLGGIIAYILRPVVSIVQRITRLGRSLSAALVYVVALAVVVLTLILIIPGLVTQVLALQSEAVSLIRDLNAIDPNRTFKVLELEIPVNTVTEEVNNLLGQFARSLAASSISLISGVAQIVLLTVFTFLISFYITRDGEKIILFIEDLIPLNYRSDAQRLLTEIDKVWGAFFRGQVILALIVTVILTIVSAALGLPRPLLLGILGGLLEFLPSIGNIIWGTVAITTALVEGSTHFNVTPVTFAIITAIAYVGFAQLDINILVPNIIGRQVKLHPMVVILGVITGAIIGGVLGVALAAPTIASLRILGRYVYAKLFGMNPFPMIGPPSVPWFDREKVVERRMGGDSAEHITLLRPKLEIEEIEDRG